MSDASRFDIDEDERDASRTVVLHYHLFKNAGTSLDALFQQQFGDAWVTREFPAQPAANSSGVREWISQHPDARCFSSHTALLPPPVLTGVKVLPVIFVRHPLDRIASAYSFEHQQQDAGFGSTLARHTSLRGYIETRLSIPQDQQCRNFHVTRFSRMVPATEPGAELAAALRALHELPFVGVVEQFGDSLARLQAYLQGEGFSDIQLRPVQRNVSRDRADSLEERLERFADEVGQDFYDELVGANADDLAFYDAVLRSTRPENKTALASANEPDETRVVC